MEIVQILILVFALFALSRLILRVKDRVVSGAQFLFWTTIWVMVIIISIIPNFTSAISQPLGIKRGMDIAIYASIVLIFYLIFRMYVKIDETNRNLTKIVRNLAKEKPLNKKSEKHFSTVNKGVPHVSHFIHDNNKNKVRK